MTLFSLKDRRIQIILDETNGPYICIILCTHLETKKKPQKNNPTHLEDTIYNFILSQRSTNTNHPG